jgi:hypothetical protein
MGAGSAQVRRASRPTAFSWWLPVVLALIALAAVLFLPNLRAGHSGENLRIRQSVQFALTGLIVIACTTAYLWSIARATPLGRPWFAPMLSFGALMVAVKFILSPSAYRISGGDSLGRYLGVGLVVMVFYLLAPLTMFVLARRYEASRRWSWPVRVLLFCVVACLAAIARFAAAPFVGARASQYLHHVFSGAGLILPVALALMAILVIAAFERGMAVSRSSGFHGVTVTFTAAALLIVVYHALWVIFMVRIY